MNFRNLFIASMSMLALGACGGGGGEAGRIGAPAPVQTAPLTPITVANAKQVAANGYAANELIGNSSSSVTGVLTGVSIGGPGISAVAPVLKLVRHATGGAPLLTGVSTTRACTGGGSLTVDATLSNPQRFSNGDTMSLTANNCVEDGEILNGRFSITIGGVSGDLRNSATGSASFDTRFSGFSIVDGSESATISGDMRIVLTAVNQSSQSITVSGSSLQSSAQRAGGAAASMTLSNYSLTSSMNSGISSATANFTLAGSANGLGQFSYAVRTLQPLAGNGTGMPTSGALIVNGAASSVTVTALNASSVRLDYSAKGDGVITQTLTLSWAEFMAAR